MQTPNIWSLKHNWPPMGILIMHPEANPTLTELLAIGII